jgi:hypothetical protein
LRQLAAYLARTLGLLIVGLLPAGIVLTLLAFHPSYPYGSTNNLISLSGANSEDVFNDFVLPSARSNPTGSQPYCSADDTQVIFEADSIDDFGKVAYCRSAVKGLLYSLMVFNYQPLNLQRVKDSTGCVVQRPYEFHKNWLWPIVDDVELSFLVTMILGSLLLPIGRQPVDSSHR